MALVTPKELGDRKKKYSKSKWHTRTPRPLPYACGNSYHLGSGSHGQLFRPCYASSEIEAERLTFLSAICIYANCRLCRAVQILITTSCSTYVKLFERGLNESFIASVFCDQELDGQG